MILYLWSLLRSKNVQVCMQELQTKPKRVRTLGKKALQQVEQALQGGQQAGPAGSGIGATPAQRRSQEDADRAMQMLLVIVSHEAARRIMPGVSPCYVWAAAMWLCRTRFQPQIVSFVQDEEDMEANKKPSKAALKRAKKKAAAKQAAGAAETAAPASAAASPADTTEPNPPPGCAADSGAPAIEPRITATTAELRPDVPAAEATSGATSAAASRQSAADWMVCPLSKVGSLCGCVVTADVRPFAPGW
jgi:hypothetical protein